MKYELLIGIGITILINLFFFIRFERRRPQPEEILPIVVVVCTASLGRLIFSVIPQVQPVTVLVILMGSVYGCDSGFITGALCAIVSNLLLGEGPWTLFQMVGWGMTGFLAGGLEKLIGGCSLHKKTLIYAVYSFFAAYLFSVISDILSVLYLGSQITYGSALSVFLAGITFNTGHAVFNVVLMLLLYELLTSRLTRIKQKTMPIR